MRELEVELVCVGVVGGDRGEGLVVAGGRVVIGVGLPDWAVSQLQAPHVIRQYPFDATGAYRLPFFMKASEHLPNAFCSHACERSRQQLVSGLRGLYIPLALCSNVC